MLRRGRFATWMIMIAVWVLLLSLSMAGFSATTTTMDQILTRGELRVSMELGNPPWNFKDPKTGEITGMATELARMYAKELGVNLEIKAYDWAGVIPALITHKVDMIATCLSRTIPRSAKIIYTEPYIIAPIIIVAQKGEFKTLDDLNKEGVILTSTAGSFHETLIPKLFPKATMRAVPTNSDCITAVLSGRANAWSTGRFVGTAAVKDHPDKLEVLPGYVFVDSFAFAVRPESAILLQSFNLFMRLIKLDGRYGKLYEKWMGQKWEPVMLETAD